jgi:chromosome segregation ATPase
MVAKQQGKLISVLLEPLTAEQFPMGLYAQQAANLSGWSGDYAHDQWRKFRREFEAKLTPLWVRKQIDEIEAELVGERTRREGAERRDRTMQAQIAKEVEAQQALKRERDDALDEVAALKGTVEKLTQARADAEARAVELLQRLRKVPQSKVQETARSIGAAVSPFVIAAAVATLGFWTYQLIWSAPQPLMAVTSDSTPEAEQQRLKEEVQRQAEATAYVETKLKAAEAELQRQAEAAGDADAKRKAAEAEQQRLRDEVQRQTKAAADADAKRRAAEAEQQRLAAALSQSSPAATNKLFEIRRDMEAKAATRDVNYRLDLRPALVRSMDECEQKCTQSATCNAFTLSKTAFVTGERQCYLYSDAELVPNSNFDSGVRR